MDSAEQIIDTNEAGTVRLIREDGGVFVIQRELGGRWFSVLRDPKPFFADNREGFTPEQCARRAFLEISETH